jgi:hypothetical protein
LLGYSLAFQRSPVRVEGYLDDEKTIWYTGGQGREDPDNVGVAINWRHGQADPAIVQERMEHYVQVSRKIGKELLQSNVNRFYVGVVLRDYVSPEDFEQIVTETGIQVRIYALRGTLPGVDPSVRWSFFGGPSDGKLVLHHCEIAGCCCVARRSLTPHERVRPTQFHVGRVLVDPKGLGRVRADLQRSARNLKADRIAAQRTGDPDAEGREELSKDEFKNIPVGENDAVLNGIYTFEAVTDAEGYRKIRQHPRVYHVDVTATWAYEQVKDQISWEKFFDGVFNLGGYNTFEDMERMGLDKFKEK